MKEKRALQDGKSAIADDVCEIITLADESATIVSDLIFQINLEYFNFSLSLRPFDMGPTGSFGTVLIQNGILDQLRINAKVINQMKVKCLTVIFTTPDWTEITLVLRR